MEADFHYLSITLDLLNGTGKGGAIRGMLELANQHQVKVIANFNGCQMTALPGMTIEEFTEQWERGWRQHIEWEECPTCGRRESK